MISTLIIQTANGAQGCTQRVTSDVFLSPGPSDVISVSPRTSGCPVQGTVKQTWEGAVPEDTTLRDWTPAYNHAMTQTYISTCLQQSPFLEVLKPLSPAPELPWVPRDQRRGQWVAQPASSGLICVPRSAVWFVRAKSWAVRRRQ